MKVLFDQGVPVPLRKHLPEHEVSTAFELGWNELSNGELIEAAENAIFDVLITTDQNLRYQQNLNNRTIAIVVLMSTSWPKIQTKLDVVSAVLETVQAASYTDTHSDKSPNKPAATSETGYAP